MVKYSKMHTKFTIPKEGNLTIWILHGRLVAIGAMCAISGQVGRVGLLGKAEMGERTPAEESSRGG